MKRFIVYNDNKELIGSFDSVKVANREARANNGYWRINPEDNTKWPSKDLKDLCKNYIALMAGWPYSEVFCGLFGIADLMKHYEAETVLIVLDTVLTDRLASEEMF